MVEKSNIQATHGKYYSQESFLLSVHMKVPNDGHRQA